MRLSKFKGSYKDNQKNEIVKFQACPYTGRVTHFLLNCGEMSVIRGEDVFFAADYYLPLETYLVTRRISDDDIPVLGPILFIRLFHSAEV